MRRLTTRQPLNNTGKQYPYAIVCWEQDADQLGYDGEMVVWTDDEKRSCRHTISVRQSLPIGGIYFSFDECKGGARAFGSFEGTRLDERDLQWATAWAIAVMRQSKRGEA